VIPLLELDSSCGCVPALPGAAVVRAAPSASVLRLLPSDVDDLYDDLAVVVIDQP
jgi:hypothetical protein